MGRKGAGRTDAVIKSGSEQRQDGIKPIIVLLPGLEADRLVPTSPDVEYEWSGTCTSPTCLYGAHWEKYFVRAVVIGILALVTELAQKWRLLTADWHSSIVTVRTVLCWQTLPDCCQDHVNARSVEQLIKSRRQCSVDIHINVFECP